MRTIPLTQGKVALVDDADFEFLNRWKWYAWRTRHGTYYAVRNSDYVPGKARKGIRMHRVLCGGAEIDHRDGDGLNNTRGNLRPASDRQNCGNQKLRRTNTSGFKGVSLRRAGVWSARLSGKRLGDFRDPRDAARVYDAAAVIQFGEFARVNFPKLTKNQNQNQKESIVLCLK